MVRHLKILGLADRDRLQDSQLIENLLKELIYKVGMEPIGNPTVYVIPLDAEKLNSEQFQDEGGITSQLVGFHTLTTSHIAIHTWPLRHEFHLDLYSCRAYDRDTVVNFLTDRLEVRRIQVTDCSQGCEWSSSEGSTTVT